jgi:hypothetical protein
MGKGAGSLKFVKESMTPTARLEQEDKRGLGEGKGRREGKAR